MVERRQTPEREREIGSEIVRVYRAWHELERERNTGVEVIDFDLAPDSLRFDKNPFSQRADVIEALGRLSGEIDTNTTAGEFLHAKTVASSAYLRALEGEKMPLSPYLEQTLAIAPSLIPEEEIEAQFRRADKIFRQFGQKRLDRNSWPAFLETARLTPLDIQSTFTAAKEKLVPIIQKAIGQDFELVYELQFMNVDRPWINWISGDASGFIFRINSHPRNQERWFRGVTERLAVHEMGGHLVQVNSWRENIRAGVINPGYGVTAIPGPEQWSCEGMADVLAFLVPGLYENLSLHGQFSTEYTLLKDMVYNNAHIRVNEPGEDADRIHSYVQLYLPSETDERTSFVLGLLQNDPRYRAYYYTYSSGGYHLRRYADILSEFGKIALLKDLYAKPMTPRQIQRRVEEMKLLR